MDENNEHQEGLNIPVTDNNSPEPPENNSPEPAPSEEPAAPESAEPEKPAEESAPETPAEPVEEAPAESEPTPEATPAPEPTPVSEPEPLPEQPSKEDVIADIREKAKDSEVRDVMTDFNGEKTELIEQAESESAAETGVKPVTFGENVKKKSSGLIVVLVILFVLLLAAGGIFLFAPDLVSNLLGGTTSSPAPAKIALDDSEEEEEKEEETEETETTEDSTETTTKPSTDVIKELIASLNCEESNTTKETLCTLTSENIVNYDSSLSYYIEDETAQKTSSLNNMIETSTSGKSVTLTINQKEVNTNYNFTPASSTATINFDKSVQEIKLGLFGQAAGDECLFFVMEDGTLEYIKLYNALKNDQFEAKTIENVNDVIAITKGGIHEEVGGYVTTYAVRSDKKVYNLQPLVRD